MASSVEQQLAATRERATPTATAPAGGRGGALDPQRRKAAAAALQGRIAAHRQWAASGSDAVASARSLALKAFSPQGTRDQVEGLKDQLRDLQSRLTEALSVQSRKESKHKLTTESISDTTAMNERLRDSVADMRNRRDKHAAVISEQLQALEPLEAKCNEDTALREKVDEAVSWFEKFLGFQVVGQEEGVKFIFNKIDLQSPEKECSIRITFYQDRYNLLECAPHIKDVEELVKDLNLSNNLSKFVRIAREKFQSSDMNGTISGTLPVSPVIGPDVSVAPLPSPMVTLVDNRNEDVPDQSLPRSKNKRPPLPSKRGATDLSAASPGSLRRSTRSKGVR